MYILLVTNHYTKWMEFNLKYDARIVAKFLYEQMFCRFGITLKLMSDREKHFLNQIMEEMTNLYIIKQRTITLYHSNDKYLHWTRSWFGVNLSLNLHLLNSFSRSLSPFSLSNVKILSSIACCFMCTSIFFLNYFIAAMIAFRASVMFNEIFIFSLITSNTK